MQKRSAQQLAANRLLHNRYLVKAGISSGGFGITYLAEDTRGYRYVIKEHFPSWFAYRDQARGTVVPYVESEEQYEWSLEAFRREASQLSVLNHPNIVRLVDAFDENGTAYYVMPYLSGGDLVKLTQRLFSANVRLSQAAVLKLMRDLLGALQHMHSRTLLHSSTPIYHLDIKPANVLLTYTANGEDIVPTLIDFGSAEMGSPGYMPHEQRAGQRIGPWTDLYALGATMHKLLVGAAPPSHLDEENNPLLAPPPRALLARNEQLLACYDVELLESIDKALEWEPSLRFASASEWLNALSGIPLRFPDSGATLIDFAEPEESEEKGSKWLLVGITLATAFFASLLGWLVISPSVTSTEFVPDYQSPLAGESSSVPEDDEEEAEKRRREAEEAEKRREAE
ncbi:MAG: serine/threonine-protein kinase, partial [Akkermansia sp.]|nr:serine/threonine-protein kinase [Akkermansia sp.]